MEEIMVDVIDKTGEPRSEQEILEAKEAIMKQLIQGPLAPIQIHFPVILDAFDELLQRRKSGENHGG